MESSIQYTIYQIITGNLNSIGRALLIAIGSLGAVINLCVFARHTMRRNPFSVYMMSYNIANLCTIWFSLFPLFINTVFVINPTLYNLTYCRTYYYLAYALSMICPSYLILASIDRVLISSLNALTRQKSTRRLALLSISGVTFAWFLFYIQFWFHINMQSLNNAIPTCYFDLGIYSLFINYSSVILNGLLPPIIMFICTIQIMKNFRGNRVTTTAAEHPPRRIAPKNRQFIIMLFVEIIVYTVFSLMQPIFLSYKLSTLSVVKTLQQQRLESFVLSIANFFSYIPNCVSFYCNITCSSNFRKQVIQIWRKIFPSGQLVAGQQTVALQTTNIQRNSPGSEQHRAKLTIATTVL